MTDLLNTGKSALFAFQRALSTTSNNIANVHTDGYSKQRVNMESVDGDQSSMLYIGAGVRVADVERIHDQFATARVISATSAHAEQEIQFSMASRLDNLIANEGMSVSPAINDFFNALQDANNDASSLASRGVVIESAEQLANRFYSMQEQLEDTYNDVNARTSAAVESVDEIAQAIANINKEITSSGSSRGNGLLDERERLVRELSTYIDVDTMEQDNGALNIFIGKGIGLVVDGNTQSIKAVPDDTYPDKLQIQIGNENSERNISSLLQGGVIGGLTEFSSDTLDPAMQQLGRLALVMADQFNNQHGRGIDLNGETGTALFETSEPTTFSSDQNTGTGVMSATISDTSLLEPTDYLLRFDGATYTATRSSDGTETSGALPLTIDGLDLSMAGTPASGDTFVVSATTRAASSFKSLITDPETLALAGKLSTSSDITNVGDSLISAATVSDPDSASLTDPINIVFSSDTAYDIIDVNSGTTLTTGAAYTAGDTISLNGWEVVLQGSARTGDTHRIEPNTNELGNNSNGLSLTDMQSGAVIDDTQSFNDAYGELVSRIGSHTNSAESRTKALGALLENAIDRQQSIQGVSLDEEAIDLTRYQQAYQASAQIITAADNMFQTILGAVR